MGGKILPTAPCCIN